MTMQTATQEPVHSNGKPTRAQQYGRRIHQLAKLAEISTDLVETQKSLLHILLCCEAIRGDARAIALLGEDADVG